MWQQQVCGEWQQLFLLRGNKFLLSGNNFLLSGNFFLLSGKQCCRVARSFLLSGVTFAEAGLALNPLGTWLE